MALEHITKGQGKNLIHHSDRGIQYCSKEYIELLEANRIQISMTEKGDPLENAIAERVNGILKNEYLSHQPVYSFIQAQLVLEQSVFFYNCKRPHLSCNMLAPEAAYQQGDKLKRRWKNYYPPKQTNTVVENEN